MVTDAWYFLFPLLLAGTLFAWFGFYIPLAATGVLAGFTAYFFRDPERVVPSDSDAIVSPADGRVVRIQRSDAGVRISIFLSPLDVHVNRAPISGVVERQEHRPGRFIAAYHPEASVENEQVVIGLGDGRRRIEFALIAGIVARRIRPWRKLGDRVNKGDRMALIRFGSRADVMLPPGCSLEVREKDRVYAGSSIIARWKDL
jgi:phosphatidylserine decarboxylase